MTEEDRRTLRLIGLSAMAFGGISALRNWLLEGRGKTTMSPRLTRLWRNCGRTITDLNKIFGPRRWPIPPGSRPLAVTFFWHLGTEHFWSILTLFDRAAYGSANVLVRPVVEAAMRGMWLAKCATEEQAKQFLTDPDFEFWHFPEMADAIDRAYFGGKATLFSGMKGSAWRAINDYCHGGLRQVSARIKPGKIQSNYAETQLMGALSLSTIATIMMTATELELLTESDKTAMFKAKIVVDAFIPTLQEVDAFVNAPAAKR